MTGHTHGHDHKPTGNTPAFALGVSLNVGFVVLEVAFGLWAGSMALLADAGHNLGDVLGLRLAWGADALTRRPSTPGRTYGWRSSSILAALLNAVILLVAVGGIAWESARRIAEPGPVAGRAVIAVALVGTAVNATSAFLFMGGRKRDLNLRGAFLHMAADAGVSLGVAVAGVAILVTGWRWVDPTLGLLIAAVILASTWGLLRESVNLALDAVPEGVEAGEVEAFLRALPGVEGVHDLHIWGTSTTEVALTAHLIKPDPIDDDATLSAATAGLHDRFRIEHATLQWERSASSRPCRPCR